MPAGKRDRFVIIEQLTETQDETGQPIETWTTFKELWMGKSDIRGREQIAGGGLQDLATEAAIWTGLWLDGVTPKMRIVDGERIYEIKAVVEIGRRAGMELTAIAIRDNA